MIPIKYQLDKTIIYRGDRYTVHPSALNSSNLSVTIPNIEILGTVIETDTQDVQPFKDARRTIWSKGSKYIPGLKNFEVIKFLGGKPPKIKYEIDNPKIKYFNLI